MFTVDLIHSDMKRFVLLPFLPSVLSSFFMLSFLLLIYFLTCLLPDLSIYFFQNRPVLFPGRKL